MLALIFERRAFLLYAAICFVLSSAPASVFVEK
jgi:hypothetical protein